MTFNDPKTREAKVVFAGIAPLTKGTTVHLEYPRIGQRLGGIQLDEGRWLNPDRIRLPSQGITYVARDGDHIIGPFHWTGRSQGMVEAVIRGCEVDSEVQQTYFLIDIIAERIVNPNGIITPHSQVAKIEI